MVDAKEIKVPDIQPAGFIIEIIDDEQEPVAGVEFNVAVDGGNAKTVETDADGILKVSKPKRNIKLSLAGKEVSTTSEEPAKPVEEESEIPAPLQSHEVLDIQPANFIIEILDDEQKQVAGVEFSVAVDDGNVNTIETDEDGILKVAEPKSEIRLFLIGERIA